MTPPLSLTLPLTDGRELRLVRDGKRVDLQSWQTHPDGHEMMAGGVRLTAGDLRVLIHAVRYALWDLERQGLRAATMLPPDVRGAA